MLHKPMGCVSATSDPQHRTVLDLLPPAWRDDLHIAGRLDFNTTGLMILTNDGQWSRRLTQPQTKLPKVYHVETEDEIGEHYVAKFREGFYFAFEDLTTQPAQLDILGPREARLAIVEGRYHQVKRMFGHFNNKVVGLHRESMGMIRWIRPCCRVSTGTFRPRNRLFLSCEGSARRFSRKRLGSPALFHYTDRPAVSQKSPERHLRDQTRCLTANSSVCM
jgi:pseudouridine synthase